MLKNCKTVCEKKYYKKYKKLKHLRKCKREPRPIICGLHLVEIKVNNKNLSLYLPDGGCVYVYGDQCEVISNETRHKVPVAQITFLNLEKGGCAFDYADCLLSRCIGLSKFYIFSGLTFLDIRYNGLKSLKGLHKLLAVVDLDCSSNDLQNIDWLPPNLLWVDCSNNRNAICNGLPNKLQQLTCGNTSIDTTKIPESVKVYKPFYSNDYSFLIFDNTFE
jgi:Leucine-rich repeat (LRR) protein